MTKLKLLAVLAVAGLVAVLVPAAHADTINGSATSFSLTQCNTPALCGIGSITVTPYTDGATNELRVAVTMTGGFGLFGNGMGNGAIGWNGTGLAGGVDDVVATQTFTDVGGGNFSQFGSFADSLSGPAAANAVSSLTFDIVCASTPCSVSGFALHVINTETGLTGFDATTGVPVTTPEPSTSMLLGFGLLGLVGLRRKQIFG
jgi:hypothetical protein